MPVYTQNGRYGVVTAADELSKTTQISAPDSCDSGKQQSLEQREALRTVPL